MRISAIVAIALKGYTKTMQRLSMTRSALRKDILQQF